MKLVLRIACLVWVWSLGVVYTQSACAQEAKYKETRNVEGFTRIKLSGIYRVFIKKGKGYSVVLQGQTAFVKRIKTEVYGALLDIGFTDKAYDEKPQVTVIITLPALDGIEIAGIAHVHVFDPFTSKDVILKMNGSGTINGTFYSGSLRASIAGSGNMHLKGKTNYLIGDNSGSGNIDARDLKAKRASLQVSGSANFWVWATQQLDVEAAGAVNVTYKGTPKVIKKASSGGAVIQQLKS
jgi:hypothetical protein